MHLVASVRSFVCLWGGLCVCPSLPVLGIGMCVCNWGMDADNRADAFDWLLITNRFES